MTDYIQVITTTEKKEDVEKLSREMVGKRLAACAQILGPITSTFRWEGSIDTAEEWLLIMKTRDDLYEELEKAILEIHPYDVPEILATPVIAGNKTYLDWLNSEVSG
ncbi:MAG: divalent-cation tolerance protein CutA [Deltaproteobacteria bacterium]|nr:divalent-cation tolerance protein CutA [Deltaproteobacteria bacterium]